MRDLRDRVLALIQKRSMTTDQLSRELRTARSTVVNAINSLRAEGRICIVEYIKTGVSPARLWGIGSIDAPRPQTMSSEERNAKRRARRELEQMRQNASSQLHQKRRDVAASWF